MAQLGWVKSQPLNSFIFIHNYKSICVIYEQKRIRDKIIQPKLAALQSGGSRGFRRSTLSSQSKKEKIKETIEGAINP